MSDDGMTIDTEQQERTAPTSRPSHRAPDISTPMRRPSSDPTLGDGSKPPTTFGWAPTPTLRDRRALNAPAFVVVDDDASRDAAGAQVAEGLERLGRPVERVAADAIRPRRSPGPLGHPLVVHVGTASALHGPTAESVARTVAAYRPGATIVVDLALRGERPGRSEELRERAEQLVARADVVVASTRDLEWLYPDEPREGLLRRWLRAGPGIVVISSGSQGAWAANAVGVTAKVEGRGADDAGDAFSAGLLDALWKAGLLGVASRADLRTLVWGSLQELVDNAVTSATIAARTDGLAPTRDELDAARGIPQLGR